jgi:Glyoxalase-like domain
MPRIARLSLTALDCPDPLALADFYAQLTGWPLDATDEEIASVRQVSWIELSNPEGGPRLAFQRIEDYVPPTWPDGPVPQQAHLDFDVPDLDRGQADAVGIGALVAAVQPRPDSFRVMLDPAGHPFCLVLAIDPAEEERPA